MTMAASRRGSIATVLRALVASAAFAAASTGSSVFADILTFDAYTQVNSSPNIPGSVTATISDNGTNDVLITLNSNLTLSSSFVMDWAFNISNPQITFNDLTVSTKTSSGGVASPNTYDNSFNPSSFGSFGLVFHWTMNNHSFGPNSSITLEVKYSGSQTFDAEDFNVANNMGYYSVAKIAGLPQSNEFGQTTVPTVTVVPEPSTVALAILGAIGFVGYGVRRRLKKSEIH